MNPNNLGTGLGVGLGGGLSNTLGAGLGGASQQQSTEELLLIAKMHGGAVGDIADELSHPERSILSTVGKGFKNAFGGFIDIISKPSRVLAGIIDPDKTIGEAITSKETVSEALLGERPENLTTLQKVGSFAVRLPIDILTDPVTYVTFGAGSGILGMRALSRVSVQDKRLSDILNIPKDVMPDSIKISEISKQFDIVSTDKDTLSTMISKAKAITDKDMMVNQFGQDWLNLNAKAQAEGIGDISQWSKTDVKNIASKMGAEQGLQGKDLKDFVRETKKLVDEFSLAKRDAAKVGKVLAVEEGVLKQMVDKTIAMKAGSDEIKDASTKAMSRLLAHNPALMETFLDKGGIKFFGAAIVSGARIGSTVRLIPGMSKLDNITQPTRQFLGGLFYRDAGLKKEGISQTAIRNAQKYADLAESKRNQVFKELPAIWQKLGITQEESELMVAGIELNKRPGDAKMARIFDLVNGKKVADMTQHEAEIVAGIRKIQGIGADAYKAKIEAGFRTTKSENYIMHFTDNEVKSVSHGNAKLSTTVGSNKFAKIAKYNLLTDKNLTDERLGSPEQLGLMPTYKIAEEKVIKDNYLNVVEKIKSNEVEISNQINTLTENIFQFVRGGAREKLDMLLDSLPEKDRITAQALFETSDKYIKPIDVGAMAAKRAKATMEAGIKMKADVADMSEEALLALVKRIHKGEIALPGDVNAINDLLKTTVPKFKVSKHVAGVEGEIKDVAAQLKQRSLDMRKAFMEENIAKEDLSKFLNEIVNHFTENPTGMNRILDQILGNKQKLGDLAHELEMEKLAYHQTIKDLPAISKYYTDKDGRIFERTRASIAEAETLGVKFDKDGLSIMMRTSLETIRATTAKHMIDAFGKEAGLAKSMAPDSWVPVSVGGLKEAESFDLSKLIGSATGEQLVFHPEVAKRIESFISSSLKDEATSELMKKFDAVQNIWKASVTSIWPSFHGRNAISNVFLNFLDIGVHALDPTNHIFSAQMIGTHHELNGLTQRLATSVDDVTRREVQNKIYKLQSKVMFTDASGINWTHGMLNQTMKDNGIAFNPNLMGYMDLTLTREEQLKQVKNQIYPATDVTGMISQNYKKASPISQEFIPYKIGRKVGNVVEDQARIINFVANLKNTGDVSLATERTKQFLFDYSNLSEFEKVFMRRIFPFYTWTRKNIELQVQTLLSAPGRIAAELHIGSNLGDAFSGGELTEEEKAVLPSYLRNSMASGFTFVKSKTGDKVQFQSTAQLPIDAMFTQGQMNVLMGSMSPLLRVPIEQATGYSFFKGKQLADITNALNYRTAPDALKEFIGYTEEQYKKSDGTIATAYISLRPERMNMVNNLPIEAKALTVLNQLTNQDKSTGEKAIYAMFGMSQSEQDLSILELQQKAAFRAEVIKVLKDAKVGREFHKFYLIEPQ